MCETPEDIRQRLCEESSSEEDDTSETQPTIKILQILTVPVSSPSPHREPEARPSGTQSRPPVSTHYSPTSPDDRLEEVGSDVDSHLPLYATCEATREFFLPPPALRTRQMTRPPHTSFPTTSIQEEVLQSLRATWQSSTLISSSLLSVLRV